MDKAMGDGHYNMKGERFSPLSWEILGGLVVETEEGKIWAGKGCQWDIMP